MTYIGYVRGSKEKQELTIDTQISMIKEYCLRNKLELKEIVKDIDYSGKNLNRPGIQNIIQEVIVDSYLDNKEIDGIVFAKLDRLTRNVGDLSNLIEHDFKNIEIHSVLENLESKSAGGRLFINMLVSVSSWERAVIGERTKAVLQHKISNGQHVGRIPFGKVIGEDGKLVDCPKDGWIRKRVLELRNDDRTYKQISKMTFKEGGLKDGKPLTITLIERICKTAENKS